MSGRYDSLQLMACRLILKHKSTLNRALFVNMHNSVHNIIFKGWSDIMSDQHQYWSDMI